MRAETGPFSDQNNNQDEGKRAEREGTGGEPGSVVIAVRSCFHLFPSFSVILKKPLKHKKGSVPDLLLGRNGALV
jgi:hypothetical protein